MKKQKLFLYLVLCIVVVFALGLLSGCKGADGVAGPQGPAGANGTNGTNGTNAAAPKLEACLGCHSNGAMTDINSVHPGVGTEPATHLAVAKIDNVTVSSGSGSVKIAIDFTVQDGSGAPIPGFTDLDSQDSTKLAHVAFNIAKLIPGSTLGAGEANQWWTISAKTSKNLTDNGGGLYTYVTGTIASSGTGTADFYDPAQRTRIVMRVMPNNSQSRASSSAPSVGFTWEHEMGSLEALGLGKSDFIDIVNGAPVTALNPAPASKDIVRTASCLECHDKFGESFHAGEGRVAAESCAVCHYQTRGSNPVGSVEYGSFVHKIHTGQMAGSHDFTEVTYPQDIRNCTKCHKGGTDSDNWKTKPTMKICTSCHSDIVFKTAEVVAGKTLHTGGVQNDNSQCASVTCHSAGNGLKDIAVAHVPVAPPDPKASYADPAPTGFSNNTNAAWIAAAGVVPAGADAITYDLKSVGTTSVGGAARPTITFKLKHGNGTDVVFTAPTSTTSELMPNFVGSPSIYFAWSVPQDGIAAPADFNATASGYIKNIWNGAVNANSSSSDDADMTGPDSSGYYTITLKKVTIGSNARMLTGGIGYSYSLVSAQPLTQTNVPGPGIDTNRYAYNTSTKMGGMIVPAPNVWKAAKGYNGRRVVVDTAKCNKCHDGLGSEPTFHAGQRNDGPTCSFCHTPNRTSSGWSANAASFVHSIHSSSVRTVHYNWHAVSATENFSEITYPGVLSNCKQCHVDGGYDFSSAQYNANFGAQGVKNMLHSTAASGTLASSSTSSYSFSPYAGLDTNFGNVFSTSNLTSGTYNGVACSRTSPCVCTPAAPCLAAGTTLVTSPITAVCSSCHDSSLALDHMKGNGGSFYEQRNSVIK